MNFLIDISLLLDSDFKGHWIILDVKSKEILKILMYQMIHIALLHVTSFRSHTSYHVYLHDIRNHFNLFISLQRFSYFIYLRELWNQQQWNKVNFVPYTSCIQYTINILLLRCEESFYLRYQQKLKIKWYQMIYTWNMRNKYAILR